MRNESRMGGRPRCPEWFQIGRKSRGISHKLLSIFPATLKDMEPMEGLSRGHDRITIENLTMSIVLEGPASLDIYGGFRRFQDVSGMISGLSLYRNPWIWSGPPSLTATTKDWYGYVSALRLHKGTNGARWIDPTCRHIKAHMSHGV